MDLCILHEGKQGWLEIVENVKIKGIILVILDIENVVLPSGFITSCEKETSLKALIEN